MLKILLESSKLLKSQFASQIFYWMILYSSKDFLFCRVNKNIPPGFAIMPHQAVIHRPRVTIFFLKRI